MGPLAFNRAVLRSLNDWSAETPKNGPEDERFFLKKNYFRRKLNGNYCLRALADI